MKRNLLVMSAALVITLTGIFAVRVSADTLALVVGVILGVAASVPTTLIITMALSRQQGRLEQPPHQPPVIVVTGQNPAPVTGPTVPQLPAPVKRAFTIIGEEGTEAG